MVRECHVRDWLQIDYCIWLLMNSVEGGAVHEPLQWINVAVLSIKHWEHLESMPGEKNFDYRYRYHG